MPFSVFKRCLGGWVCAWVARTSGPVSGPVIGGPVSLGNPIGTLTHSPTENVTWVIRFDPLVPAKLNPVLERDLLSSGQCTATTTTTTTTATNAPQPPFLLQEAQPGPAACYPLLSLHSDPSSALVHVPVPVPHPFLAIVQPPVPVFDPAPAHVRVHTLVLEPSPA